MAAPKQQSQRASKMGGKIKFTPAYNRNSKRSKFYPLQAGSVSYKYLKFGSSGLQAVGTVNVFR